MSTHTSVSFFFFFFNDTATTEIYTLSLHDALPISEALILALGEATPAVELAEQLVRAVQDMNEHRPPRSADRKSTRLNSSHLVISYAVFCLKKKKKNMRRHVKLHRDQIHTLDRLAR